MDWEIHASLVYKTLIYLMSDKDQHARNLAKGSKTYALSKVLSAECQIISDPRYKSQDKYFEQLCQVELYSSIWTCVMQVILL